VPTVKGDAVGLTMTVRPAPAADRVDEEHRGMLTAVQVSRSVLRQTRPLMVMPRRTTRPRSGWPAVRWRRGGVQASPSAEKRTLGSSRTYFPRGEVDVSCTSPAGRSP